MGMFRERGESGSVKQPLLWNWIVGHGIFIAPSVVPSARHHHHPSMGGNLCGAACGRTLACVCGCLRCRKGLLGQEKAGWMVEEEYLTRNKSKVTINVAWWQTNCWILQDHSRSSGDCALPWMEMKWSEANDKGLSSNRDWFYCDAAAAAMANLTGKWVIVELSEIDRSNWQWWPTSKHFDMGR